LRAQLLDPSVAPISAVDVVRRLVGIQAQMPAAGRLGIRARSKGLTDAGVEAERLEDRSIVRVWAMRGTIHIVASEDEGWLRQLLAPLIIPESYRRMNEEGLARDQADRAVRLMTRALADGPLTRAEIGERLRRRGITPEGAQALAHLVRMANLKGLAVIGPPRGAKETMALTRDWLPKTADKSPDDPAAELARRFLIGYGPATLEDFAWWSGLRRGTARSGFEAIAEELVEVKTRGSSMWRHRSARGAARPGTVRLLPHFDDWLLGYRDRDFIGKPAVRRLMSGGMFLPFVIADGRAIASWKIERAKEGPTVRLEPFGSVAAHERAIAREIRDVKRFLSTSRE